jgi:Matrixin
MHEIGHMIGMDHCSDADALMYYLWDKEKTPLPIFNDIRLDDAVGARYVYKQPAMDGIMALVNETRYPASYKVYVSHAVTRGGIALGEGSMPPQEVTYWREKKDFLIQVGVIGSSLHARERPRVRPLT